MPKMRVVLRFSLVVCALMLSVAALATGDAADGKDSLTVEETLGAVLDDRAEGFGGRWNLYRHSNSGATEAVLALLENERTRFYREAALRVLGYIGEDGDVESIQRSVLGSFTGLLTGREANQLRAFCDCMGLMVGRGSEAARKLLDQMTTLDYSRQTSFRIRRPSAEVGSLPGYEHEHEGVMLAFDGYSLSNISITDLGARAEKILASIESPEARKYMTNSIDASNLARIAADIHEREMRPIADEERNRMRANFREQANLLAPPKTSAEDAAFLKEAVTEALAAFAEMRDSLVKGEVEKLKGRLLDDGEIPRADRVERLWNEYQSDLKREDAILKALTERNSVPGQFTLLRATTFEFAEIPKDGEIKARKTEVVTVTAQMSDSAKITAGSMYTGQRGSLTVAKDGTLIVVMKKIDGKWYWNPFGW